MRECLDLTRIRYNLGAERLTMMNLWTANVLALQVTLMSFAQLFQICWIMPSNILTKKWCFNRSDDAR